VPAHRASNLSLLFRACLVGRLWLLCGRARKLLGGLCALLVFSDFSPPESPPLHTTHTTQTLSAHHTPPVPSPGRRGTRGRRRERRRCAGEGSGPVAGASPPRRRVAGRRRQRGGTPPHPPTPTRYPGGGRDQSPLRGGRHGGLATGRNHSFAQTHQESAGAGSVSGSEPLRTGNGCKPVRRIYKRRKQKQTSKTESVGIHWGCNALGAGLVNATLAWLMASTNPPEALLQPPPG